MVTTASTLLIPVENQVRELDAKLLLACLAAERGFPVLIGSRAYLHYVAGRVPRGVYLAKSMRVLSETMFKLLRMIGHDIVAWEEEALVHPPADTYFTLRLSPQTVKAVSHVFAWGQDNLELLSNYPHLPPNLPVHITGNPRGDMLRPELRAFFDEEVAKLRKRYGNFVLINTNYSDVNPFMPGVGLFDTSSGDPTRRGQAGIGMSDEFAVGLAHHKGMLFKEFLGLVPKLAQSFPARTFVVRPHPSETFDRYRDAASGFGNVHVDAEGNIIPWLLAADAMIHNGCTTGIEAYALGRPALAFLPGLDPYFDFDFQGLPNRLSHQSQTFESLQDALTSVFNQTFGPHNDAERDALLDHYLAARGGDFACDRILDLLSANGYLDSQPKGTASGMALLGRALTVMRAWHKQRRNKRTDTGRQAYHDHRFPPMTVADVEARVERLGATLGRFGRVVVQPHSQHVFSIFCT